MDRVAIRLVTHTVPRIRKRGTEEMTPDEEMAFWVRYNGFMMSRQQRKGQALMNALREFPILFDMIAMTNADPFNDDNRIPAFADALGIQVP